MIPEVRCRRIRNCARGSSVEIAALWPAKSRNWSGDASGGSDSINRTRKRDGSHIWNPTGGFVRDCEAHAGSKDDD